MPAGDTLAKGNLKIGVDAASAVSVADAVTEFALSFSRPTKSVKPTLATGEESVRAGAPSFEIKITYYTDDVAAAGASNLLLGSLDTADGRMYFEGSLHEGVVSATNPKHSGFFYVTGAGLGGEVGEVAEDSQTYPLTGRWMTSTTP
ncbi:hypothetical protein BH24ACT5_BH24ACT5_04790 [soil metagenome]